MDKFQAGDRVKICLKRPYTKKEIQEGCDPNVDGKFATVLYRQIDGSYYLQLEEIMKPCREHQKIEEFNHEFQHISEEENNLELA